MTTFVMCFGSFMVGGVIGFLSMALVSAASLESRTREIEEYYKEKFKK